MGVQVVLFLVLMTGPDLRGEEKVWRTCTDARGGVA